MSAAKKKKKKGRIPAMIVHPDQLKTPAQQETFVDKAVDTMMGLMDEYADKNNIPRLK